MRLLGFKPRVFAAQYREVRSCNKSMGLIVHAMPSTIVCLLLVQIVIGCGLPQATLLEKPEKLDYVHISDHPNRPPLPDTVIAFGLPDDDTDIIGYVIYYKVYYSASRDPDYREDGKYFDENSYISTNDEMQPGSAIPNQRGFLKVGEYGKSEFAEYYIGHRGNQKAIYIDFDPGGEGGADANDRNQPIIGYDYPVTEKNKVKVLARGFIDPRDETGNKFRSFVADWEYDDRYHDGDLRRGYFLLDNQPGRTEEDIRRCGNPYFKNRSPDGTLRIGFVVHSYGRIQSSFKPVTSKPVYFGDVGYSPIHDSHRL